MSSTIVFIGDVMVGRMIGSKYTASPYKLVSEELVKKTIGVDYVIANLESPVVVNATTAGDHLQFKGSPNTLNELKWIDAFSLANNHINDCGSQGMDETIRILEDAGFHHNGLFKEEYCPLLLEKDKIAVVTITDMMNIPFSEENKWDVMRAGEPRVMDVLKEYHEKGFFVILYAHIGMLFSRYPNPVTYEYLHKCIDNGADAVVTAHSHCLGCMETYKGRYIFHSIGDFVMDGNSFRRRRSGMLRMTIDNHNIISWEIIPAEINYEYQTVIPTASTSKKMMKMFGAVSQKLADHKGSYEHFFKWQYKKEMLSHSLSTLFFLLKTRGAGGMLKMIFLRYEEVCRMLRWVSKDRSRDQRDDDAIKADRKKFSQNELFDRNNH